jgi:hypothetical protein
MTKGLVRVLVLGALLVLSACSGRPREPYFSSVALPPLAANTARVYFYRAFAPYDSLSRPWIRLNGAATVISEPGGVSFHDVPPGSYEITADSVGIYWNQFKHVDLKADDTLYVRLDSIPNWMCTFTTCYDTFVVSLINPAAARAEMADLRYVPSGSS